MVMSKRKLQKLVEENIVRGWDDPRLPTLNGLKRRGYTADAINEFVDTIGVTRRGNENIINIDLLEHCIRKELDEKSPRTMAVVDPLQINLLNLKEVITLEIPAYPKTPEKSKYLVKATNKLFIERADFREVDNPNFFGLSLNKIVGLKYVGLKIKCVKVNKSDDVITSLDCEIIEEESKPKGVLHWISDIDSVGCHVRIYDYLFKSLNPSAVKDWISDLNPDSLHEFKNSLIHKSLLNVNAEDKFQFERVGYFVVDNDSTADHKVFNRTVTLVETKKKKGN